MTSISRPSFPTLRSNHEIEESTRGVNVDASNVGGATLPGVYERPLSTLS